MKKIIFLLLLLFLIGCAAPKGNLIVDVISVKGYLEQANIEISKVEIGGVAFDGVTLAGDGQFSLGAGDVKTGRYNLIKIYWGRGQIVKGGEVFYLEMPSEPTLVNQNFVVNEENNVLKINIDLDRSSVKVGPGAYRFMPAVAVNQNI